MRNNFSDHQFGCTPKSKFMTKFWHSNELFVRNFGTPELAEQASDPQHSEITVVEDGSDGNNGGGSDDGDEDDLKIVEEMFTLGDWCTRHRLPSNSVAILQKLGVVLQSDLQFVDEKGLLSVGGANYIEAKRIMSAIDGGATTCGGGGQIPEKEEKKKGGQEGHYAHRKEKEKKGGVRKRNERVAATNEAAAARSMRYYRSRVAWVILLQSSLGTSFGVYSAVDGKCKNKSCFAARYLQVGKEYPNSPAEMIKRSLECCELTQRCQQKCFASAGVVKILKQQKSESFNPLSSNVVEFTRVHPLDAWDNFHGAVRLDHDQKRAAKRGLVRFMDELDIGEKDTMDWVLYCSRWKKEKNVRDADIKVLKVMRTRIDQVIDMSTTEIRAAMHLMLQSNNNDNDDL
eukprot:CAMPEP_0202733700 /NCGR_PEP_ID=MMETSP1385-20130828/188300_1 /ASSEMBLY_ACC=CAM_ASM_000861 /TAXON_ID=933848 /ORGANISM="Elphidium margaritaceum" /LENGTH=400 /DNA_ID=CAMNT_0049400039 /DNA_START=756 /DNA_END=1958 /DNA_ORIENTATION=+